MQKKMNSASKQQSLTQNKDKYVETIFRTCNDWLAAGDDLHKALESYQEQENIEDQELSDKLTEFARQIQQSTKKTKRLKRELIRSTAVPKEWIHERTEMEPKAAGGFHQLFFYLVLFSIVVVLATLFSGGKDSERPRNIAGYSPMTVLTRSMQSVYPQNSFIVSKVTDPKDLKIGEDITYIKENNTTVTHRIVGINENYMGTGKRGFETKGVENPRKDEEVVRAENVVGKVVFSNVLLGNLLIFVRENLVLSAITMIITFLFIDALFKYIALKKRNRGD